jgi:hypothetical protein
MVGLAEAEALVAEDADELWAPIPEARAVLPPTSTIDRVRRSGGMVRREKSRRV